MNSSNSKYIRTHNENSKYKKHSNYITNSGLFRNHRNWGMDVTRRETERATIDQKKDIEEASGSLRNRRNLGVDITNRATDRSIIDQTEPTSQSVPHRPKLTGGGAYKELIARYLSTTPARSSNPSIPEEEQVTEPPKKVTRAVGDRTIVHDYAVVSDYKEKKRLREARRLKGNRAFYNAKDRDQTSNQAHNDDNLREGSKLFQKLYKKKDMDNNSYDIDDTQHLGANKDKNSKKPFFITRQDNIPPFSEYFDNMDRVNHEVTELPEQYNPSLGTPIHHSVGKAKMGKKKKIGWVFWRRWFKKKQAI